MILTEDLSVVDQVVVIDESDGVGVMKALKNSSIFGLIKRRDVDDG